MKDFSKGEFTDTFNSAKERGVRNTGGFICFLPKPSHFSGQDERYESELNENKANAKLITEAFNVANETGMTPRELSDQNAKLLDALKELARFAKPCEMNTGFRLVYKNAIEAIKNTEQS